MGDFGCTASRCLAIVLPTEIEFVTLLPLHWGCLCERTTVPFFRLHTGGCGQQHVARYISTGSNL